MINDIPYIVKGSFLQHVSASKLTMLLNVVTPYMRNTDDVRYSPKYGQHNTSFHIVIFVMFLCTFVCSLNIHSQERLYIDFVEKYNESASQTDVSLPLSHKANRLRHDYAISFQIEHDGSVPDSIVRCLEVSADIWRSCLNINTNYKIRLQLFWESLPENEDVRISVAYANDTQTNNKVPTSLFYSLNADSPNKGAADARIRINKDIDWDCGYSISQQVNTRSLTYAMLRSIAVALGFGSSLSVIPLNTGDIVKFPFTEGHSFFDELLVSDDSTYLREMQNTGRIQNPDIIKFCTGGFGNVFVEGMKPCENYNSIYKMYTPPSYENGKSLIYLDNNKSLMHFSLNKSEKKLQIDTVTTNILNKIGWDVRPSNNTFKIVGNNIPESGITSAYTPHSFYIEGNGANDISNAKWFYYLPLSDGNEILKKSAEGSLSFNIDAITEASDYDININGDIYGKIVFTGLVNGNIFKLQYNLSLELKPSIFDVSYSLERNKAYDSYDAICKVNYKGADYLYVTVEEEYGSTLRSQFVREPFLAHFTCNSITSPYYAWIDIKATNQYGSDTYTIELPPYTENPSISNISSCSTRKVSDNKDFSEVKVYNLAGQYMKTLRNYSDIRYLSSGSYIIKFYKDNIAVQTIKLIK